MPEENKRKYAHWLRPDTIKLAEEMYRRDNCASRSEYMAFAGIPSWMCLLCSYLGGLRI